MIQNISILTSLVFSAIYPLCFWVSFKDPLKNNFHKFHLGLPNVVGGITLVGLLLMPLPIYFKIFACVWKATLLFTSRWFWKKGTPNPVWLTVPALLGLTLFVQLQNHLIFQNFSTTHLNLLGSQAALRLAISGLLGGFILTSVIFAMNLGHWYLNVKTLPMSHLKNSVFLSFLFLLSRVIWDAIFIGKERVLYGGEPLNLLQFMGTLDGFLLSVALFFGTLFPFGSLYFVYGTLKAKSNQSTTGILYVILSSILLGDMAYKYYAIKFGIFL